MIPRYSRPEMARLWSDENRFATWLTVEIAATEVLAERGRRARRRPWPPSRSKARFDVARIEEIEKEVQHDVIAFVSNVAENVGPEGRWLHYGLTSSDVVDTALAMLMRDALRPDPARTWTRCWTAVKERALEHKHTPMIGRTHGVHAEPMTFGLKLALWYAELRRDRARLARARDDDRGGQALGRGGDVLAPAARGRGGGLRAAGPAARAHRVAGAAARPPRRGHDRRSPSGAASLEKFATEIRALQKTEVREVEEPFGAGQKGSLGHAPQAQPGGLRAGHRPRPAGARERRWPPSRTWPSGTSATSATRSVERVIVPDSFLALDHMLRALHRHRAGPDRQRRAHAAEPGVGARASSSPASSCWS